jgi:hypothetical protein
VRFLSFDIWTHANGPDLSTFQADEISPSLCADSEYMKMRLDRMAVIDPPGIGLPPGSQNPADRLRQYCATVTAH